METWNLATINIFFYQIHIYRKHFLFDSFNAKQNNFYLTSCDCLYKKFLLVDDTGGK